MPNNANNFSNLPAFDDPLIGSSSGANIGTEEVSFPLPPSHGSVNWKMPFYDVWIVFFGISAGFTALFIAGTIYSYFRILQIRSAEHEAWEKEPPGLAMQMFIREAEKEKQAADASKNTPQTIENEESKVQVFPNQEKWNLIISRARSQNENDRKQAVIEADIMLSTITKEKGYEGESLGDRLKKVEAKDWNTIDLAWEAHKYRNKVAHGDEVDLSEKEIVRVLKMYEQIFREFKYIS